MALCCTRRSESIPLVQGSSQGRAAMGATRCPCCRPSFCVSLVAALGGVCFGVEIGIIDSILAMRTFALYFHTLEVVGEGDDTQATGSAASVDGNIVALFLVGCCLGSALASYAADAWGRKACLVAGSILFTLGGATQAAAAGLPTLYTGRLLAGSGIGLLSMIAPLFIAESASKEGRGALISLQQLLITVGIFAASCSNAALYAYGAALRDAQWRAALAVQCIPGLALLGAVASIPPSPRWLVLVGRLQEAHEVVALLRERAVDDPAVTSEVESIQDELASSCSSGSSGGSGSKAAYSTSLSAWALRFRALFSRGHRKRTLAVCALQFFQQWSGINAVLYFAAALFLRAGVSKDTAATTLVVCNSALLVIGTIPGMLAVDRESIGRRRLLLGGSAAMAAAHCAIALLVSSAEAAEAGTARGDALSYAAVGSLMAFTFFFSATWGPVAWVVSSEVFDLEVRAQGVALGTLVNWASNAVIGKVTPLLVEALGGSAFFIFFAACAASGVFVQLCLPETTGVALEDMGALFAEERPLTRLPSYEDGSPLATAAGAGAGSGAGEAAAPVPASAAAAWAKAAAAAEYEEQGLM
jgi:sugar porter (SP) family MFS transporter